MAVRPNNQPDMFAVNFRNRGLLLASSLRQQKNLNNYEGALGATTRVKLFNVGVVTSIGLHVTCPVTIGTATATPSAAAPYNLINRIRVTDYDGTDRVNLTGYQLYVLNSVRERRPAYVNNEGTTAVVTNPTVPTAVGDGTIQFFLDIPIAFDERADLRGAIMAQTGVGDLYLSIDWNSNLLTQDDDSAVYVGEATSTVVVKSGEAPAVNVFQRYLLPQRVGANIPIPEIDLATVYELSGNLKSSDNLASGAEKLMNYPNLRSVVGFYWTFVNNKLMDSANISKVRQIVNGNNVLVEDTLFSLQMKMRKWLGGDLAAGTFFQLNRDKPIETQLFGNVQLGITPSTVTGTAYVEQLTESFYTKGMTLPGLTQT